MLNAKLTVRKIDLQSNKYQEKSYQKKGNAINIKGWERRKQTVTKGYQN